MFVFYVLPLLVMLTYSCLTNLNNKSFILKEAILHIGFQTLISYFFVYLFFLQGFISRLYVVLILIALILILGLLYFVVNDDEQFFIDKVERLEAIKNHILFFLITVLPLYFFLSIFKYLPGILQILTSVVLTVVFFLIALLFRKKFIKVFEAFFENISLMGPMKFIVPWIIILVFMIVGLFVRVPLTSIEKTFNLNNKSGYFVFDNIPADVKTNYEQEWLSSLKFAQDSRPDVNDFLFKDGVVYLYGDSKIELISTIDSSRLSSFSLPYVENIEDTMFNQRFFVVDNLVFFLYMNSLYIIDNNALNLVYSFSTEYLEIIVGENNELYILHQVNSSNFDLYVVDNIGVELEKTINPIALGYEGLAVVSQTLFFYNQNTYYLYGDEDLFFANVDGTIVYDRESRTIFYYDISGLYQVFNDKKDKIIEPFRNSLIELHAHEGQLFIMDLNYGFGDWAIVDGSRIIVYEIESGNFFLYNHQSFKRIVKSNDYHAKSVLKYRFSENGMSFIQVETNVGESNLVLYFLEEKKIDIQLPFYSHYGILTLIWIFVGVFVPITDNSKFLVYLDFKSMTNKEKQSSDD